MADILVIVGIALFSWWVESKKKKRKARKRLAKTTINPADYNKNLGAQHGQSASKRTVYKKRHNTLNHQPDRTIHASQRAEEPPVQIDSLGGVWHLLKSEYDKLNQITKPITRSTKNTASAPSTKTGKPVNPWGKKARNNSHTPASNTPVSNTPADTTPQNEESLIPAEVVTSSRKPFLVMPTVANAAQSQHAPDCVEQQPSHQPLQQSFQPQHLQPLTSSSLKRKAPSRLAIHNRQFSPKAAYLHKELFDRPIGLRQTGGKVWE